MGIWFLGLWNIFSENGIYEVDWLVILSDKLRLLGYFLMWHVVYRLWCIFGSIFNILQGRMALIGFYCLDRGLNLLRPRTRYGFFAGMNQIWLLVINALQSIVLMNRWLLFVVCMVRMVLNWWYDNWCIFLFYWWWLTILQFMPTFFNDRFLIM